MDVFERMDMFFRRVEMYTEVQLTIEMVDIFIQIIVEVLFILRLRQMRARKTE
jgi:hypothetical protein